VQDIDVEIHIKLLKFTLIAPYLPPFFKYKKNRLKSRGTVREYSSKRRQNIPKSMLSLIVEISKYKKEL
jgi:hypothetical protein